MAKLRRARRSGSARSVPEQGGGAGWAFMRAPQPCWSDMSSCFPALKTESGGRRKESGQKSSSFHVFRVTRRNLLVSVMLADFTPVGPLFSFHFRLE